jgi:hypothetical protein
MLHIFDDIVALFGQQVSVKKTKVMVIDREYPPIVVDKKLEPNNPPVFKIRGSKIDVVVQLKYVGSCEHWDGGVDAEVNKRIQGMHAAFVKMEGGVYRNWKVALKTRCRVFEACVMTVGVYGAGSWNFRKRHLDKLDTCYFSLLRRMLGKKEMDKVTRETMMGKARDEGVEITPLRLQVYVAQLRYYAHVYRMDATHLQRKVVFGRIVDAARDRRAPHLAHRLTFNKALEEMGVMLNDWKQLASVRLTWRKQLNNHGPKYFMGHWLLQRESEREKRHAKEAATNEGRQSSSQTQNAEDAEKTEGAKAEMWAAAMPMAHLMRETEPAYLRARMMREMMRETNTGLSTWMTRMTRKKS